MMTALLISLGIVGVVGTIAGLYYAKIERQKRTGITSVFQQIPLDFKKTKAR